LKIVIYNISVHQLNQCHLRSIYSFNAESIDYHKQILETLIVLIYMINTV